jgi:hypothetical protein
MDLNAEFRFEEPPVAVLVVGIVLLVAGPVLAYLLWGASELPEEQLVVPGDHELVFSEPGLKNIAYEHRARIAGERFETGLEAPDLAVKVWEKGYPKEPINVLRDWNPTSYDTPERAGRTLFFFTAERPTTYVLRANYTSGTEGPDLVLAVGALDSGYFTTALMLGLGCFTLGLALIVRNLLQRSRARKIASVLADSE